MVVERETIGAQAAQPAISDSRSVLRQRRCQPVSRKVHEGAEKGGNENQFPYSLPTTKFFKFRWGKRRNWYVSFSPVIPLSDFVSKTFLGDITFSPRSIREPDNSSQTHPPLPVCIGLDSVGVSATWVHFHLIPVNAGHAVNIPFPLFVSPPTPYNSDGSAHQPPW